MREVHTALAGWMARAGMTVRVDAIGNIRGVYPPVLSPTPVAVGAALLHRLASRYGAERRRIRWRAWGRAGHRARRDAWRKAVSVCDRGRRILRRGRRALRRAVPRQPGAGRIVRHGAARSHRRRAGARCATRSRSFGLDPNRIPDAQAPANALGYLEFHIEQGPVLENLNLPLAVVDVISGQSRADVTFDGMAAHAGTTPMKMRKDALACAAAWIAEVEREALATSGLVATVGRIARRARSGQCRAGARGRVARCPASGRQHAQGGGRAVVEGGRGDRDAPRAEDDVRAAPRSAVGCDGSVDCGDARSRGRARGRSGPSHVERRRPRCDDRRGADACRHVVPPMRGRHQPSSCRESVREEDVAAALDAGLMFLDELEHAHRG